MTQCLRSPSFMFIVSSPMNQDIYDVFPQACVGARAWGTSAICIVLTDSLSFRPEVKTWNMVSMNWGHDYPSIFSFQIYLYSSRITWAINVDTHRARKCRTVKWGNSDSVGELRHLKPAAHESYLITAKLIRATCLAQKTPVCGQWFGKILFIRATIDHVYDRVG